MIRNNCPESLGSYFFNLCLFRIFPDSLFWNHTLEKSNSSVVVNMDLVFLLADYTNSLLDDCFPYKYMLCLCSQIWLNRMWGSWYLIIWLEIMVQRIPMDFWTVTLGSGCLKIFYGHSLRKPSWLSNITKIPFAFKQEL